MCQGSGQARVSRNPVGRKIVADDFTLEVEIAAVSLCVVALAVLRRQNVTEFFVGGKKREVDGGAPLAFCGIGEFALCQIEGTLHIVIASVSITGVLFLVQLGEET